MTRAPRGMSLPLFLTDEKQVIFNGSELLFLKESANCSCEGCSTVDGRLLAGLVGWSVNFSFRNVGLVLLCSARDCPVAALPENNISEAACASPSKTFSG